MLPVASRFKDALLSLRRQYGLESDIDRVLPFIVFDQDLTENQLVNLLVDYPSRVPEDFKAALVAEIQHLVRAYWVYRTTRKGYHKVLRGVRFLEDVARHGFDGCQLTRDKVVGYVLELKPQHRRRSK